MYLPLEYVKRYSVLTELYCSEEYINCEPEVLLEMIADADWGTSNYSGPNKERYIHTYNMFDNNYFAMHIISACFATAGFAGVWKYNKIVESVMKAFLKLRHALVPYLYTMNYCANKEGKPLVMPMYYLEPEREEAYQVPNNYYFGSELMVSPITEKIDTKTQLGKAKTWLPSGVWYDFFNGRKYEGGRMVQLFRGIEEIPVLAREGAIVPLKNMEVFDNDTDNPKSLEIKIFPGKTGSFTLWEDEGDCVEESWVETKLEKAQEEGKDCFIIHSPQGNTAVLPEKRCWKLDFVKIKENTVSVLVDGKETAYKATVEKNGMCIEITEVPVNAEIKVVFENPIEESLADLAQEAYAILEKAQISYNLKSDLYEIIKEQQKGAIATLASMELEPAMFGALCEILTAEK